MIKISIIGQSAFGESVAKEILKMNGTIISSIFSSSNPKDPLYQFGLENDLPVKNFKRLRDNEAIESFKSFDVDLLVMAYVTDIVPMEIIKSPRLGTIQYHPSLLPLHRGPSSINWAIINGDKKTGISIFWPDEGLDTGPILLQKEVEIDKSDTTGSLYFNKLFPIGVESIIESIKLVIQNKAPKIDQNENYASYESWCSEKQIDWNDSPNKIYDLIRGCDPQPGSWTIINSKKVFLYDCKMIKNDKKIKKHELYFSENQVCIGIDENLLVIGRMKTEGEKKISSIEWVRKNKIEGKIFVG